MVKKIKSIFSDTLYVSKITKTNNKKIKIFLSVVLSQVIAGADILIILFFTKLFSDVSVLPNQFSSFENIFDYKFLLPTTIILRYYFQYLQSIVLKNLEFGVQKNLKVYLLDEIFENRNFSTADTFFYVNTLANHISYFFTSIASFLNYLLQTAAFTIYLFITEPSTISAFLLGIIFLIYPIFFLIKKSREYEQIIYDKGRETNRDIQRVIENAFLIKLLKKEKDESERYYKIISELYKGLITKHKITVLNSYLPPFTTVFLISIIALFFNSYFVITLSFMGVTLRMFQSLANVSNSTNQIVNSQVHLDTFYKMELYKNTSLKNNYILAPSESSTEAVVIKNVDFKYLNSELDIFNNLNLSIKRNSHTVFTGVNGSGKSTLLGLLAGVYYPNEGSVIAKSTKLGFVGPVPLIFLGSLKENLLYGNNINVSDQEILNIIKEFKLFGDEKNINLLKTISNKSLSSGQMQKIAFMRVMLSEVDTLFLDESTSNLDEETKGLIFKILKKKKLTIINSTHDLDNFDSIDTHYKIEIREGKRVVVKVF